MRMTDKSVGREGVTQSSRRATAVLAGATVIGLTLLIVPPASSRDEGQATGPSKTTPAVASTPADAQEAVLKEAGGLAETGKLAEAEARLNTLLTPSSGQTGPILTLHALKLRGDIRARLGKFQAAAADMEQVVQTDPANKDGWPRLTLMLAQTGDVARCRQRCKEMLRRFGDTTDPVTATQAAKSCLVMVSALDPEDVVLAERLADAAGALTAPGAFFPWRNMTIGLAEYRRGEFARAGKILDRLLPAMDREAPGWLTCQADVFFISALNHQQLKEPGKARAALDQGRELVSAKLPSLDSKDLQKEWWDVVYSNLLMAEAVKSIEAATTTRP